MTAAVATATGADNSVLPVTTPSTVWLLWAGVWLTVGVVDECLLTLAANPGQHRHIAGEGTGATGLSEINGLRPTNARTLDTAPDTTFGGANGAPDATGTAASQETLYGRIGAGHRLHRWLCRGARLSGRCGSRGGPDDHR